MNKEKKMFNGFDFINRRSASKLIDTEDLIDAVRHTPILWDTSHPDYKLRGARLTAWTNITEQVVKNYAHMSKTHKHQALRAVQNRWKTARDAYTRSKMRDYASVDKKYVYFDKLTFLESKNGSDAADMNVMPSEYPQPSPVHSELPERGLSPMIVIKQSMSPAHDEEQTTENYEVNDYRSEEQPKTKRHPRKKTRKHESRAHEDDYRTPNEQNDDLDFFKSLLPIVNKFSDHQKLKFRSDVLKIAMNVHTVSNTRRKVQRKAPSYRFVDTDPLYSDDDAEN